MEWSPSHQAIAERLRYYMLIETCKYYKFMYYEMHVNEISDQEYDKLEHEIKALEEKRPHMIRPDSPTQSPDIACIRNWRIRVDAAPEVKKKENVEKWTKSGKRKKEV